MNETQVMLKVEDWVLQARTNNGPDYTQAHEAMNYNHICYQKALFGLASNAINQGLIVEAAGYKRPSPIIPIET